MRSEAMPAASPLPNMDAPAAAKSAGLRYVSDTRPGIARQGSPGDVPLHRRRRRQGHRRGHAGAHQVAGDSARMDRCLDLRAGQRPPAGHRARRQGPQAVPLPRALAQPARRGQVRTHAQFRQGPARDPAPGRRRAQAAGPAAREGAGHRGLPAGTDHDADRERGIRAHQQVVRPDHAAQPPCARSTARRSSSASAARAACSMP